MGVLDEAVATRTADECRILCDATLDDEVRGYAAGMKCHADVEVAFVIVQVTLNENDKQNLASI